MVVVVRSRHVRAPVRRRRQGGVVAVGWAEFGPGKGERREKKEMGQKRRWTPAGFGLLPSPAFLRF